MKSFYLLSAAVPSALGCSNWRTHACGGAFVSASADAASFCATFTSGVVTATDAVPSNFLSACEANVNHLSSACSCYVTGGAEAGTPTAAASTLVATPVVSAISTPTAAAPLSSQAASQAVSQAVSQTVTKATAIVTLVTSTKSAVADTTPVADANACIVTEYAQIASAVASCTDIVLSDLSMPASSTLDLQSLQTGAVVTFAGTTTFGTTPDSDFDPIVISGDSITIAGAAGHVIEGNGAAYWDGQGSNGGSEK